MSWWEDLEYGWEAVTFLGTLLGPLLTAATIGWVLMTKKDSTSAVAWCLTVLVLPVMGPFLFLLFGYQHVTRSLRRKRQHKQAFQSKSATLPREAIPGATTAEDAAIETSSATDISWKSMGHLAQRFN